MSAPKPRDYHERRRWQDAQRAAGADPECGREACKNTAKPAYVNAETPLLYCATCARMINRYTPGLCTVEVPDWRHRAQAADDLLSDIAAVCRGEMPPEPREGGPKAHRAAWDAVCALRSEVTDLRNAYTDGLLDGSHEERAAVVKWLREHGMAPYAQSNLDYAATMIEHGEHRNEEKK